MSAHPPPYSPLPPPYSPLPTTDPPPAYPSQPPSYTPGPAAAVQQQSSTVVVTSQPIAQQLYVTVEPRAADNLVLTVVMMIVCASLLNPIVFICLVPALFFSLKAGAANEAGDYGLARRRGQHSLWLNLTAMISFIALMILGILLGVVLVITNA